MGCTHLRKDGKCGADVRGRRCLNVEREICKAHFVYKKVGQVTLG